MPLAQKQTETDAELIPVANLIRYVGKELQRLRETTEDLQASISNVITSDSLSISSAVSELQDLDELTQVLENLSNLQGKLAEMVTTESVVDPHLALSDIKLEELKRRLMGLEISKHSDETDNGDVDLF
ncbi:MAG: hypothetical protein JXQ99_11080 [Hyphomicrobiaceae bacterium]